MAIAEITGTKARELVDAGAQMAKRESAEGRVRQTLNAGSGASGRTPPASKNYAQELNNIEGTNVLSRLFTK